MKQWAILHWFILYFLLTVMVGCEAIWNYGNKGTLKKDIVELFKKHGVVIKDPVCNMIGTSREATCEFRASIDQVSLLVQNLRLKEVEGEGTSKADWLLKAPPSNGGCLACPSFKHVSKIRIYRSDHRPSELRLKRGTAFEYLILFQDLETNKVCVQLSYSYG